MKVVSMFLFVSAIAFMASCTKSCVCGRQCLLYNGGTVKICETSQADSGQFAKSIDSLNAIYGVGTATHFYADSVNVSGTSFHCSDQIFK